jgi:lambda repressor-like predicted transcriptional regulator
MVRKESRMEREMGRKGVTYRALAATSTYSGGYLCRVAHRIQKPSWEAACAIAGALGVEPGRLWGPGDIAEPRIRRPKAAGAA